MLSTDNVSQLCFLTSSYASSIKISKYVCEGPIKTLEILGKRYWKSFGMYKWTKWLSLFVTSSLVGCPGKLNSYYVWSKILGHENVLLLDSIIYEIS